MVFSLDNLIDNLFIRSKIEYLTFNHFVVYNYFMLFLLHCIWNCENRKESMLNKFPFSGIFFLVSWNKDDRKSAFVSCGHFVWVNDSGSLINTLAFHTSILKFFTGWF